MNIVVLIPPYVTGEPAGIEPNKAMLPVGPLAVATLLRERGHRVVVVDLVFAGRWEHEIRDLACPDILLVSCHTVRNIGPCRMVLRFLSEQWGRRPYTVLGGNVCVELGKSDFQSADLDVDAVIRGYAHSPRVIDEILTRTPGDIFGAAAANLPVPALDLLTPATREAYLRQSEGRYPIIGHAFGCLYRCSYCSAKMNEGWVPREREGIVREIEAARLQGYEHLWCVDNLIFVDPARTVWFDQVVSRHGMTWSAMTRPELLCRHASALAELNALTSIAMGIESASVAQLAALGRGAKPDYLETCRQAFALTRSKGIESVAFVILDLPGSTESDFEDLLVLLNVVRPDTVSWAFYNPPEKQALASGEPGRHGFYRWPLGASRQRPERVVQHAMILSGVYWHGWHLMKDRRSFMNRTSVGVRFEEGTFFQSRADRSLIGDLWETWYSTERR